MTLKQLKLVNLKPDPRSANEMGAERMEKLVNNMRRSAHVPPIIVRPDPNNSGCWIIIDGHCRVKSQEKLGRKTIPSVIWEVDEKEAGIYLATLNQLRGEDHPQKRAALLQELTEAFDAADLAQLLPESEEDIQQIVAHLQAEDADVEALIQRQIEEESKILPEVMKFILSHEDAAFVRQTLSGIDQDLSKALVILCQQVTQDDDDQ